MRWIVAALAMLCTSAWADYRDETHRSLRANRDTYSRVIHLFGDSISRGWALRTFPDIAADEVRSSTAWPLRSPASMLNLLIADAGLAHEWVAAYGSDLGFPDDERIAQNAGYLADLVAQNVIRLGDVVVLEDAGLHPRDPDKYEAQWRKLLQVIAPSGAQIVMVEMFDYITEEKVGEDPADSYRFSVPFKGYVTKAVRTHNQATVTAARAFNVPVLPLKRRMDDYRTALARFQTDPIHPDGIHPNIWGQCIFAAIIADAAKLPTRRGVSFSQAFIRADPRTGRKRTEEMIDLCLNPIPTMVTK